MRNSRNRSKIVKFILLQCWPNDTRKSSGNVIERKFTFFARIWILTKQRCCSFHRLQIEWISCIKVDGEWELTRCDWLVHNASIYNVIKILPIHSFIDYCGAAAEKIFYSRDIYINSFYTTIDYWLTAATINLIEGLNWWKIIDFRSCIEFVGLDRDSIRLSLSLLILLLSHHQFTTHKVHKSWFKRGGLSSRNFFSHSYFSYIFRVLKFPILDGGRFFLISRVTRNWRAQMRKKHLRDLISKCNFNFGIFAQLSIKVRT